MSRGVIGIETAAVEAPRLPPITREPRSITFLKGLCSDLGSLISFKRHSGLVYVLNQILNKVLRGMFEFVFHFLVYIKIP